jgi:hypothetical protein
MIFLCFSYKNFDMADASLLNRFSLCTHDVLRFTKQAGVMHEETDIAVEDVCFLLCSSANLFLW